MSKKTNYQKQHAASAASATPVPAGTQQPWWETLIQVLEGLWNTTHASQSEPNHIVAQKLAQLKATPPQ